LAQKNKNPDDNPEKPVGRDMNFSLLFAFLLMGFTSLVVQTLLVREFLVTFYGNELVIGIILANWLILEGLGSSIFARFSGKVKRPLFFYVFLQIGIALYFPLSIFLTRVTKNFFTVSFGEIVGLVPVFLSSFLIIAPLSLLDGIEFPFGCRLYTDFSKKPLPAPACTCEACTGIAGTGVKPAQVSQAQVESAGKVYILEAIGFIIAGPIFTYLLLTHFHSAQIAIIIGLLNLLSAFLLLSVSTGEKKNLVVHPVNPVKLFYGVKFLVVFLFGLNIYFLFSNFAKQIQNSSINQQWKGREVIAYENSIYGNLCVIKSGEQYTFYSDGIPVVTTPYPDIIWVEEFVHFSLLGHPKPENILLVSGGAGGVLREILKHPVRKVDYTELDPALIKLVEKYPTPLTKEELNDPRVNLIYTDGRRFVQEQLKRRDSRPNYDLVLLNLPAPSTLQLNRFYTVEFFHSIKKIVKPDGIFVFSLPGSLTALSTELRNLNGSILNTLKEVFPQVKIIPGDNNLFLASSNSVEISAKIFQENLKKRKIETKLLTSSYLNWRFDERWFSWFRQAMGDFSPVKKNYDLSPRGLFYQLTYWNALSSPAFNKFFQFLGRIDFFSIFLVLPLFIIFIFPFLKLRPKYSKFIPLYAVLTTGFLGTTFDLIFIFVYQSFYGYVYHHLALLVTAFMAGLTIGGWLMTRNLGRIKKDILSFIKIEFFIVIFSLAIIPLLISLKESRNESTFVFFLLASMVGFLVGLEFPLANKIYQAKELESKEVRKLESSAGMIYAADLFGAYIGALIVSVGLIPLIGVVQTLILLAVLKISSLTFLSLLRT